MGDNAKRWLNKQLQTKKKITDIYKCIQIMQVIPSDSRSYSSKNNIVEMFVFIIILMEFIKLL